jgi:hypothetical protein
LLWSLPRLAPQRLDAELVVNLLAILNYVIQITLYTWKFMQPSPQEMLGTKRALVNEARFSADET